MTPLPAALDWDWESAFESLPSLLSAFLQVTLLVTVLSTALAAVLGLVIAMTLRLAPRPVAGVVRWIAHFIRMTPIVVQLLFAYYAFLELEPLTIGVLVFGIHYSTYMSEVYRAGIDSVPAGQWEATTALSMSTRRTWTAVIIPQALRATVPALGNYAVSMFKDTPFLLVIGVVEMVNAGLIYGGNNFRYIEPITLVGVIFLLASYPTSLLISRLEKRLAYRT
ncbi:ectoine/hydroxyectoine ABC transporter permease subunit EhuD [Zhihengliuella salsuginis]|uniref:Ectoine/hydroxyectoine ABC transporter permease subunit EhuD n=1 Tax=Zhihengliuella salsuginis TaxID=578222 RepID=A0ABQ3GAQ0_9MICC|nr:ectoine/hydroxyectoine ABC transporter permease subunit EhuD [Zhihengliuella salsuginis]GHC99941.1 ectoine/hydroxyectoine ABC transporter permease subunit EhuD [Zhihengliuella salsuginis]